MNGINYDPLSLYGGNPQNVLYQDYDIGGNGMDPLSAGILGGAGIIKGLIGGGGKQKTTPDPYWSGRRWAWQMGQKYQKPPELQLPGISQEAMNLISNLMQGQLPQGVSQALGTGAERAYGAGLSGLADIGGGPATLAGMRSGIMGRLGEQKALMGWQGMQTGLGAVPEMSRLSMEPAKWGYEQQSQRWRDIAQMMLAQPGVAGLKEGQKLPGGIF